MIANLDRKVTLLNILFELLLKKSFFPTNRNTTVEYSKVFYEVVRVFIFEIRIET